MRAPMVVFGPRDQRVSAVAEAQRGRIARAQLTAVGITDGAVKHMIARGYLHREHRAVYAVGHRSVVPLGRETAALLACAPGTLLSHRSAAALWDFMTWPSDAPIDVLIADRQTGAPDGVIVHRTRGLLDRDVRSHRRLPVTSPARTLLDLADVLSVRALERAFDEALVSAVVSRTALSERVARANGRRGASLLRALLDREAGPTITRSEAEERFLALVRAASLPPPLVNARIHGFEVDFFWPAQRLVVEIDGYRFHGNRRAFERDRRKSAVLTAAGLAVIRPTWSQITDEPLALIAAVAQTLARAGG